MGQPLILSQKNGLNLSLVLTVKQCSCTCCGSSVASHGVAQMTSNNYPLPLRVAKKIKQVMEKRSERVMKMRVMTSLISYRKVLLPCLCQPLTTVFRVTDAAVCLSDCKHPILSLKRGSIESTQLWISWIVY